MSQLGSADQVTDGIYMRNACLKVCIYGYTPAFYLRRRALRKQAVHIGTPAHRTEHTVSFCLLLFFLFHIPAPVFVSILFHCLYRRGCMDLDSSLFQDHLQILGNFFVHIRNDSRHRLQNRHPASKGRIDSGKFHTDDTASDNHHALRRFFHLEQLITCDDSRQLYSRNRNLKRF